MHARFMSIKDEESLRARVRRAVGGILTDATLAAIDEKETKSHIEEQGEEHDVVSATNDKASGVVIQGDSHCQRRGEDFQLEAGFSAGDGQTIAAAKENIQGDGEAASYNQGPDDPRREKQIRYKGVAEAPVTKDTASGLAIQGDSHRQHRGEDFESEVGFSAGDSQKIAAAKENIHCNNQGPSIRDDPLRAKRVRYEVIAETPVAKSTKLVDSRSRPRCINPPSASPRKTSARSKPRSSQPTSRLRK
jgi:hypothetical protein